MKYPMTNVLHPSIKLVPFIRIIRHNTVKKILNFLFCNKESKKSIRISKIDKSNKFTVNNRSKSCNKNLIFADFSKLKSPRTPNKKNKMTKI